jgi:hypothetical protein
LSAVDESAQSLTVTDECPVTGLPHRALKEAATVQISDLRSAAIDLATNRFGTPDQIACGIDLEIGGR